jgi:hypothetical protein
MAANDAIVLEAHFQEWRGRADGLPEEVEPWVYYCLEQHLKTYPLDDDDLENGVTDGSGDGGVDGFFFVLNNGQIVNSDAMVEPKLVTAVHLLFLQEKQSGGMKPTEIEKWLETSKDFFDLSVKDPNSFGTRYSNELRKSCVFGANTT